MPFPRRGRRRPFINSRWQVRRLECLCLFLSANVRSMLTAWMKIYGETNEVPGLVTGPIEVRFRRLREHTGADIFLLWTTPEHWAGGEALSLWIPAIGLALECRVEEGRLVVDKARPTTEEERDPRRQRTAIGMELRPDRIELPTGDYDGENPSAGLISTFERLLDRRWTSFVDPLREALEAEARDDAARAERLATPYAAATPRIGSQSESDPYRLSGVEASAVGAFDEGEWLDLVDTRSRVISSARLVRIDPAEGTMDIDVRGADPPSEGTVRPRPQTQILAQKRAILEELDNPTGGLAHAVRLVASPASLPPPVRKKPAAFVNKLVAQNRSQVRAVSLALGLEEGQALMVQGPPGTGKSTTLAEILGQLVTRDKNVTVLVCSHSNHGVDNLLLKTLPYLESVPDLAIARVGLFDRVHPLARPHFVPPGEDLGAFNVVFTTVDALALQVEAGGRTYDYAVLDEANRASILDSLIPLVRGRRFILVGDHLQLQPVLSEAEEQLRLEPAVGNNSAIGKSLFAWLRERRFPEPATVFLEEQNRMHPLIAGLISEVFYEGKLRSGRRAPRRVADVPLFPAAVTWVDTRGLHGLREARGRGASLVNVPEARLVATIARHILGSSQKEVEVGVISAYAEQTALLRRLLLNRNAPRQNGPAANGKTAVLDRAALKLLEIDTVDAFEGREKDIIIVSLVRSNRRRDIGFLRLMQRINVALSRAKTMLIVVGDTSTLRGSYFDRIVRYIRANGMLVPGPRLIGRLLNARNAERPGAERTTERPVAPGRRRRPLPSPRTAFPAQDPAAAVAGPGAGEAGAEEEGGQRGRRRRRRVRGRPGQEQRPLQPTTTMEMTPVSEPGNDEPATQYEIDRFAALVEQLLGDTSSDDGAAAGAEAGPPAEVDRAHAAEVLTDALRAVGEQADRTGQPRSRRNNNRRRSRRGQPRPLPGDAAVADAARRMAREELLAAGGADAVPPMEMPGDSIGERPGQTHGQPAAQTPAWPAAQVGPPAEVIPPASGPSETPPDPAQTPPVAPPVRRIAPSRAFRPFDAPALPVSPAAPAAPTPPDTTPALPPLSAPERGSGGEVSPARLGDVVSPAPGSEVSPAPADTTAPEAPVRRTRRRLPAAAIEPAPPVAPPQVRRRRTAVAPAPEPEPASPAPRRRTRRVAATETMDTPTPGSVTSPAAAQEAVTVAAPTPAPVAASEPTASEPTASEPAAEIAPARRTRRRVTMPDASPTAELAPVATVPAAPSPVETAAASEAATPAPATPRRTRRVAPPAVTVEVAPPAPATPRRTRRVAAAAATESATSSASVEASVLPALAETVAPAPATPSPAAPPAEPSPVPATPKPVRRPRTPQPAAEAPPVASDAAPAAPEAAPLVAAEPAPARTRRRTSATSETASTLPPLPLSAPERGSGG